MCADSAGGCWIAKEDDTVPRLHYLHVDSTGEIVGSIDAIMSGVGATKTMQLLADTPESIIISVISDGTITQRLTESGERLWEGEYGSRLSFPAISLTTLTPDGGAMWGGSHFDFGNAIGVYRVDMNGQPYYDELEHIIYHSPDMNYSNSNVRSMLVEDGQGGWYAFYPLARDSTGTNWRGFEAFRINNDGELIWEEESNVYAPILPFQNPIMRERVQSVACPDCTAIIAVQFWQGYYHSYLYKILPEGRLAGVVSGVDQANSPPQKHILGTYPNPFNSSVRIAMNLEKPGRYQLSIYNIQGRLVHEARFDHTTPGMIVRTWSPADNVSSGIYWIVIKNSADTVLSKPHKAVYFK
jgi:hypothetical protein